MADSLESILKGEPAAPVTETAPAVTEQPVAVVQPTGETQPQTPAAETPTVPRDDAGRFAPKAKDEPAKPAAPPAAEPEAPQHVPVTALQEERRKRQELERQAAEFQRQLAALQAKPAEQPKAPELYENPDAWREHLERQVEERLSNERLNMSEMMARQAHGSEVIDKAFASFGELVRQNPAIHQQVMSQPHPWDAMVKLVQKVEALNQIGDPMTFAERKEKELRDKIRAELEAEYAAKAPPPAPVAPPPALPTPLGSVPSVAPRSTAPAWAGPTPLSSVFGNTRR